MALPWAIMFGPDGAKKVELGRQTRPVGPAGSEQDAGPGTDFHAVRHGYVSITPIHVDLTRHDVIDAVKACLGERTQPS